MTMTVKAIAESINIMGNRSGSAMKERIQGPIQEMAKEETSAGASYLDLNIGPARKDGTELMPWVVESPGTFGKNGLTWHLSSAKIKM